MEMIHHDEIKAQDITVRLNEQFSELGQASELTMGSGGSLFEGYAKLGTYDWNW